MWIWDFVVGIILRIHIHSIQRKRRRKRHSSSCSSKHIAVLVAFMSIATSALQLFYCSFIYLVLFVSLHFHLRVRRTAMDNNNSTFAIICNYIILEKRSCVAQEMWAQRSSNIKKNVFEWKNRKWKTKCGGGGRCLYIYIGFTSISCDRGVCACVHSRFHNKF